MLECPKCGRLNLEDSLACEHCSVSLMDTANEIAPVGYSYKTKRTYHKIEKKFRIRALRFITMAMILQAVLFGAPLLFWKVLPGDVTETMSDALPLLVVGYAAYAIVTFAWLLGKTAEAVGIRFMSTFVMALFPPLIPATLARMVGKNLVWPYGLMVLCLMIGLMMIPSFEMLPGLRMALVLLMVPFLIYQLAGCALPSIADCLGINPFVAIAWVCVGPLIVMGIIANESGLTLPYLEQVFFDSQLPFFASLREETLGLFYTLSQSWSMMFLVVMYLLIPWMTWMNNVFENLRYPLADDAPAQV